MSSTGPHLSTTSCRYSFEGERKTSPSPPVAILKILSLKILPSRGGEVFIECGGKENGIIHLILLSS